MSWLPELKGLPSKKNLHFSMGLTGYSYLGAMENGST